ncbi:MAG: D-glycerate dehydrogenase [Pseudomonadota bacterium]|nr:D-glycerate dehydrogenase [Pseudomonadota bacterium]
MKIKPQKVIVTRKLPKPIEERMKELFDVYLNKASQPISKTELIHCLREADVLVPTLGDHITSQLLSEAGPNLKLIANYGAGFDHIDIQAALQRNILVSNTPDVLSNDTADMTMALILGVPRRMAKGSSLIAQGEWHGWSPTNLLGTRISGKRLGILGMGRIGLAVAKRAQSFGLEIHYHNRRRLHIDNEKIVNAKFWDNLDEMLRTIDILTIHVPHTPSTFHLMNARRLNLLGKSAFIINTARGEIIDENALTRLLRSNQIGGAGLDVYKDPKNINPRLKALDNVLLLPHMGSATHESRLEMGEKVIINIKTFQDGHRPPDQVLPSML